MGVHFESAGKRLSNGILQMGNDTDTQILDPMTNPCGGNADFREMFRNALRSL
jgi:hypothetical protein